MMLSLVLLPFLLVVAVLVTVRRTRVDDRDIAWLAGGQHPVEPAVGEVYRRYLSRHRIHRAVGGWFGVLVAATYSIAAQGSLHLGVGMGSPLGDVLLCGLAGVVAGALSAEAYRVATPPGPTTASLSPHTRPRSFGAVVTGRLLLLLAVALTGAQAVQLGSVVGLGATAVGAAVVGMAEAARRAIADRRRPVLSPEAARVDAHLRAYAAAAVARLELAAGALTAAWALNGVLPSAFSALHTVTPFLALGLLALALVQLRRARPRPPRGFTALTTKDADPLVGTASS